MRQWGSCFAVTLAAIAAAHQAATAGLGMWLAYALTIVALILAVGPTSEPIGRWAYRKTWGRGKVFIAVGVAAVTGAIAVGFLMKLAIDSYWTEQEAIKARAEKEDHRQKEEQRLIGALIESNQRADATDKRRERQLAKYQVVNNLITEAMSRGGGLRYNIEDAINAAVKAGAFPAFDAAFDVVHTPEIEKWRTETAQMLDKGLPGQGLGQSFSGVVGEYGKGRSGFRLTQIKACMEYLRAIQQGLRSYVEILIPA